MFPASLRILEQLKKCPRVDFSATEKGTGKTVLHEVFLRDSAKHEDGREPDGTSYAKCVKVLLAPGLKSHPRYDAQIARIINYQESLDGNTALHLATLQADQGRRKKKEKEGPGLYYVMGPDRRLKEFGPVITSIASAACRFFLHWNLFC